MEIKLLKLKCVRCDYEWIPRKEEIPKLCPNKKCRSAYWDKPKIKKEQ